MTGGTAGRLVRTLRHLKPRQAWAQLRHVMSGPVSPVSWTGAVPTLRTGEPQVPFLGSPRHAHLDADGRLELIGRAVPIGPEIAWDLGSEGPLWAYHLHQFDYARSPDLDPARRASWLLDWIERHTSGVGWNPHPTSLRVLSWGKLLLTPGALELDPSAEQRIRHSLACQLETLSRQLEVRLQGNHLFSNLLALVFGGHLLEGARSVAWLKHGAGLRRELGAQILADGAHVERSPMYHSLLLENVLDLINLARAAPRSSQAALLEQAVDCAERMLGALRVWTHPDGEIALFADSALGVAHPPAELEAYAASLGVRPRPPARLGLGVLADAGYLRLESGPFVVIASVAGPMPAYQPGHAHCDALSFELSVGGERVVTDTGVYEYEPTPRRRLSRSTRVHATVEVDGQEQAEIWSAHRVGGRPRVVLESVEPGRRAEATCSGWATPDTVHRRVFSLDANALEICDLLEGRLRPVRFSLPLAPGLEPQFESQSRVCLRLTSPGNARLRIDLPRSPGLRWRTERTPYFPEFGRQRDRACLVGEASRFRSAVWRFELESD